MAPERSEPPRTLADQALAGLAAGPGDSACSAEDLERLEQREAGADHGRELAREDDELAALDARAARDSRGLAAGLRATFAAGLAGHLLDA